MITTALLKARRALWWKREDGRYKKWYHYRHMKGTPAVHALRAKWWVLYGNATRMRRRLDKEIADRRPKVKPGTQVSWRGANFIKQFEGYVGHVYRDSVGVPTVGYGHTENVPGNGHWLPGQRSAYHLTEPEASQLLQRDLNQHYAPAVRAVGVPLTQNQFDALTSFVYNVGVGGVSSGTNVGRALRRRDYHGAANGLLEWSHAGGQVLPGLVRRREAERSLFLS